MTADSVNIATINKLLRNRCNRSSQITSPDMDDSIGRLPPELRNCIYGLVLHQTRVVGIGNPNFNGHIAPPITRACRQLREETRLLAFARMEVMSSPTRHPDPDGTFTAKWLRSIGPEACSSLCCIGLSIFSKAHLPFATTPARRRRHILRVYEGSASDFTHEAERTEQNDFELFENLDRLPTWFLQENPLRLTVVNALAEMGVEMVAARYWTHSLAERWVLVTLSYAAKDAIALSSNARRARGIVDRQSEDTTVALVARRSSIQSTVHRSKVGSGLVKRHGMPQEGPTTTVPSISPS